MSSKVQSFSSMEDIDLSTNANVKPADQKSALELSIDQSHIDKQQQILSIDINNSCNINNINNQGVAGGDGRWWYWALMAASSLALVVGLSSASLLGRYYFVEGGSRRWVYTWVESAGWPVLVPPLLLMYKWRRRHQSPDITRPSLPRLCAVYAALGGLTAVDNLFYSLGLAYLPVSTNSLLCATQLPFNALFAFLLTSRRVSASILNSIVVISSGTAILAVTSASDRPPATTHRQYVIGFIVTIAASALFGLLLTLIELTFTRLLRTSPSSATGGSFVVVLEVQIAISATASFFSLIGMWANGDIAAMPAEAAGFSAGIPAYVLTLFCSAVGWQLYLLGGSGIIFLASSLMSCVFMTAMIPILPILAVVFFHDSFSVLKGIAMALSIWGFISYLYHGYSSSKQQQQHAAATGRQLLA